ncbi:hypothetical protein [Aquimarina agarivorans]|uniref:hypothetical protein n=1 Tax=Aquimarina agarivorans TaxID=980584 RepID=UPI000248FC7F|nr:hypothetical protein [Aquimarina agarivorans]
MLFKSHFLFIITYVTAFAIKAQVNNFPVFDTASEIEKTEMNPKLFSLLLNVKISQNKENAKFYKSFIASLTHFEVYSDENKSGNAALVTKVQQFLANASFTKLNENGYERLAPNQKEFVLIKNEPSGKSKVYAFTTKLNFTDVQQINLLLNQHF